MSSGSAIKRKTILEREIIANLTLNPSADVKDLSYHLDVPVKSVYRFLQSMAKRGLVVHEEHGGLWWVRKQV